jgi:hypothetical protein
MPETAKGVGSEKGYAVKGHAYVEPTIVAERMGAAGRSHHSSSNIGDQRYGSQVK